MEFTKYFIQIDSEGMADVYRVNAFGFKTWIGRIQPEFAHTLFY